MREPARHDGGDGEAHGEHGVLAQKDGADDLGVRHRGEPHGELRRLQPDEGAVGEDGDGGHEVQHAEPHADRRGLARDGALLRAAQLEGVNANLAHVVDEREQRRERERGGEERDVSELDDELGVVVEGVVSLP